MYVNRKSTLCCFYFEKEDFIVYVWTHTLAYMQARTTNTLNLIALRSSVG